MSLSKARRSPKKKKNLLVIYVINRQVIIFATVSVFMVHIVWDEEGIAVLQKSFFFMSVSIFL